MNVANEQQPIIPLNVFGLPDATPINAHSLVRQTPRLLLAPLEESHRSEYVRVETISRDAFTPWMPSWTTPQSPAERFEQALLRAERDHASGASLRMAAFTRTSGTAQQLVGFFNLNEINRGCFQNAYAGWSVSADQTGKGFATEAMHALLEIAFTPPPRGLGLHRVQANVRPENDASLRVAHKLGLREEGLAKHYLLIAGVWCDHVMFAITADEYLQYKRAAARTS